MLILGFSHRQVAAQINVCQDYISYTEAKRCSRAIKHD